MCVCVCVCVCVCMSTYLVVRVIDNARTDISSVLKVSRPIWLKGWKAAPVPHLGKDPKWGEGGDDVFVAMNLHVSSLLSQTAFSRRSLLLSCYDTQATNFDTTAMRLKCDNNMIVETIRYLHSHRMECSPTSCTSLFASSLEFA